MIRSEQDYGIICLVDPRFTSAEVQRFFPAHWRPQLTRAADVTEKVTQFWQERQAIDEQEIGLQEIRGKENEHNDVRHNDINQNEINQNKIKQNDSKQKETQKEASNAPP